MFAVNALYLVCGGRDYADADHVREVLAKHIPEGSTDLWVLHGNASGADALAHEECIRRGIPVLVMPALWDTEGRSAGPKRNERMWELLVRVRNRRVINTDGAAYVWREHPVGVIAFPGGRGTDHMCRIAEEVGIRVFREKR